MDSTPTRLFRYVVDKKQPPGHVGRQKLLRQIEVPVSRLNPRQDMVMGKRLFVPQLRIFDFPRSTNRFKSID